MAGAAASIRIVVALKAKNASSASTATSTTSPPTGSRDLCRHIQLDAHRLRGTGGQETGRRALHVTLLDEGLEGGVQAQWAVLGEEPEIVTQVHGGDGGELARLG